MLIVTVLVGLMMLTLGRQIFWLFVAGVGFALGAFFATQYYPSQNEWFLILIGLAAGLVGVALAYALQRFAVLVAGFLAGGYFGYLLLAYLDPGVQGFSWPIFIVGGVIGALLVASLFDWSLIFLSALTGAALIVQSLNYSGQTNAILFGVLMIFGIAIQAMLMQQEHRS